MRKYILTSALILGSLVSYADSFSFNVKTLPLQLLDGSQIEIFQEQLLYEPIPTSAAQIQKELSNQAVNREELLRVINNLRSVEKELNEEIPG